MSGSTRIPKETELTYVRPGQPVTVTVDTYPDAEWHGTVESISPAAAQEFSASAGAEHQRQLGQGRAAHPDARPPRHQRQDRPPLRAGMSVEVDVDTGHARGLPQFLAGLLGRRPSGGRDGAARGKRTAATGRRSPPA